jgi:hypothetical protein
LAQPGPSNIERFPFDSIRKDFVDVVELRQGQLTHPGIFYQLKHRRLDSLSYALQTSAAPISFTADKQHSALSVLSRFYMNQCPRRSQRFSFKNIENVIAQDEAIDGSARPAHVIVDPVISNPMPAK